MVDLERQNYIGNLEQYEGMSLRGIAAKTGHHFNTVKNSMVFKARRLQKA
ncbi:MAG: hypothetical protein FWD71_08640 [Oscillospiraceae bacterium]|nr:hypothetical protein [Oscillospiraceae bacterium]